MVAKTVESGNQNKNYSGQKRLAMAVLF